MPDLVERSLVEPALAAGHGGVAAGPGPRDIGAISVRADHVGIERDHLACPALPVRALLVPGIRARTGSEKLGFQPVAARAGILEMEVGPEFALRRAGQGMVVDPGHAGLADAHRPAHQLDLVPGLDRPRDLGNAGALDIGQAARLQRVRAGAVQPVAGDSPVAAAMHTHKAGDLVGPGGHGGFGPVPQRHEHPCPCRAQLVDARQSLRLPHAALEFEHDRRAVGEYQRVAQGAVQAPDLHVRAIEGVSDIGGIVEQQGCAIGGGAPVAKPLQAIAAGAVQHLAWHRALQRLPGALRIQISRLAAVLEDRSTPRVGVDPVSRRVDDVFHALRCYGLAVLQAIDYLFMDPKKFFR